MTTFRDRRGRRTQPADPHSRRALSSAPIDLSPVAEWCCVIDGFRSGEPLACARVTGLIGGMLRSVCRTALTPFEEERICESVLAELMEHSRRADLRDPEALVGACMRLVHGAVPRNSDTQPLAASLSDPWADDLACEAAASRLEWSIEELPLGLRRVLHALYLEGRSFHDAARALGLSCQALRELRAVALSQLRWRAAASGMRSQTQRITVRAGDPPPAGPDFIHG